MKVKNDRRRPLRKKDREDLRRVADAGRGLLQFLLESFPDKSRNLIKAVLRDRQVAVDDRVVTRFDFPLQEGQQVRVRWEKIPFNRLYHGIQVVFEDHDLIVIDKPAGLLTVATETEKRQTAYSILSDYVKERDAAARIFVVHRIDRETSGLLLFAKNEEIRDKIQHTWMSTITERNYVAVVEGKIEQAEGTVTSWLTESSAFRVYSSQKPGQGKKAVTHYRLISSSREYSLLSLSLETGRKHQIRVHMQDIGHPVVGDKKYGAESNPLRRLGLHARVLAFIHPADGCQHRFESAIPRNFLRLFERKEGNCAAVPA
jgi:23S rRNA pseudouridine1911/1915/1917 synthase